MCLCALLRPPPHTHTQELTLKVKMHGMTNPNLMAVSDLKQLSGEGRRQGGEGGLDRLS